MEEFKHRNKLREDVKVLKGIYDPEITVDIYELGIDFTT
jgi:metal-sulfur cluster biosynthetic enzyme